MSALDDPSGFGGAPIERGTTVLRVQELVKEFTVRSRDRSGPWGRDTIRAVDSVSFELAAGETLGIVGESGCGKSTLARLITRLVAPTTGVVEYRGVDLAGLDRKAIRRARGGIQMVFQDPYSSLNPRMTVEELIREGWRVHPGVVDEARQPQRLRELLDLVGLGTATLRRYPHEFSGGQRQRIGIARALAVSPDVIICDEAVSALDVSTQAQIVNLLKDIQDELDIAYIFISHDLGVVRTISDRVNVMYLGRFVESGPEHDLYAAPAHPYTKALLAAVPRTDSTARRPRQRSLQGELPSLIDIPSGCAFRTRCWKASDRCAAVRPELAADAQLGGPRLVACHDPEGPPPAEPPPSHSPHRERN